MRKEYFDEIMEDHIGKHMIQKMKSMYIKKIRNPVILHRKSQAKKV